jgi:glycosyltransferase involved in cell wall biosynthesis
MIPTIAIISPCFNEEAVLDQSVLELHNVLNFLIGKKSISENSFIAFIDDGSSDKTWEIIKQNCVNSKLIKGLKLSTNVGHQNALLAGLLEFKDQADALISIDADLQDDVSIIEKMVLKYVNGCDVIYGVRKKRKKDSFFKRNSALLFYKIMKKIKVNLVYNHSDYRLCSNRVLNALEQYNEVNLFLRGIIPTIGFKSDVIYYDRLERKAGKSKYGLYKMISFAWNGITSFSNFPLKLVTIIGFAIFIFCFLMSVYSLSALYLGNVIPGWVSTVLPMYFLGGVQLFCFGIIGEYIGKIYSEVKRRPRYFIEKKID